MRAIVIVALCAAPVSVIAAQARVRVRTANGVVVGTSVPSGVSEFRGIPFAAPPIRELRWRPPQPPPRWTGERHADRFADQCMQARVFSDMVFRNSGTSEDCLYLNVWSPPQAAPSNLPVLVYFYGGGFVAGDGSEPRYDGESLARRGIVVVTASYRLGIFGFFAHPELAGESPHHASGNYGFLDQVAALQWVHDNIAAFGGDPARVTIAGESAGSMSVSALMASPLARGLFARAIGESGSVLSQSFAAASAASAEAQGTRFAASVGAHSLNGLRELSAMELLAAASKAGVPRFGPTVDGWFLPESPFAIYAAGRQTHVPLLAGWNSEESSAEAMLRDDPTPENAAEALRKIFGASAAEAARLYPASTAEQALESMTNLASDRFIAFSTWKWLEEHAKTSGKPVYRYFYTHPRPAVIQAGEAGPSSPAQAPRGAAHSAEIEYALGNLGTNTVYTWTVDDRRVSETMESYFENFIKTGDPNRPGLPPWPPGNVEPDGSVMHMRIDVEPRTEPEDRARYLFLDRIWGGRH
jgi:para-nitrobenzyl esterase